MAKILPDFTRYEELDPKSGPGRGGLAASAILLAFGRAFRSLAGGRLQVVLQHAQTARRLEMNANADAVVLADATEFALRALALEPHDVADVDGHSLEPLRALFASGIHLGWKSGNEAATYRSEP